VCLLYLALIYRDHWFDEERPEWLRLKGAGRFNSPKGKAFLASLGIQLDWNEYLNAMVDFPLDGVPIQFRIEESKKRRRSLTPEEDEGPPRKKQTRTLALNKVKLD
jgi:hypothetical protein